eukprot:1733984-Pyramimonas_sp.AAC.1
MAPDIPICIRMTSSVCWPLPRSRQFLSASFRDGLVGIRVNNSNSSSSSSSSNSSSNSRSSSRSSRSSSS